MSSYARDRAFSDRYTSALCRILGPFLIRPAPLVLDIREATDLMVFTTSDIRIAARVRSPGYLEWYPDDFTIRFHRHDTGAKTEMAKILEGFADWMIYGHADPNGAPEIAEWMIIDLNSFRYHLEVNESVIQWKLLGNRDYATSFLAFDVTSFPDDPPILIGRSQRLVAVS